MTPSSIGLRIVAAALALCGGPVALAAQSSPPEPIRSTRSGVYNEAQATRGRELYALSCMSCHTVATHAGPEFVAKWQGKLFWELFDYVRESMPKSEPGSLTTREYLSVLAYLLKMNGMPEGPDELPTDSAGLARIRIDFKRDSSQKR
jgi:mono/diheme cytochrome c family protein